MHSIIKSTTFIVFFATESTGVTAQLDLTRYEVGIAGSGFVTRATWLVKVGLYPTLN